MATFTYKSFLENVKSALATEYTDMIVSLGIAPMRKPFIRPCLYVIPVAPCIEYVPIDGVHTKTKRVYNIWYHARIMGFVALTEKTFESSLVGVGAKKGILYTMETAFAFMQENFLELTEPREAIVEWDDPAFFTATMPTEQENFYAAAGSFTYRVKLKVIEETELQATPPKITDVSEVVDGTSVTITWTTDKLSTTRVNMGTDADPTTWETVYNDDTLTTSHSAVINDLTEGETYYYKPRSKADGWWGTVYDVQTFGTCPADFGFIDIVPRLSKVGDLTYLSFTWSTGYEMAEKKVDWGGIGTDTFTEGPDATSGTDFVMVGESRPVARGDFHYWVFNRNACGDWDHSEEQFVTITYNRITREWEIA